MSILSRMRAAVRSAQPEPSETFAALIDAGNRLEDAGRPRDALEYYDKAVRLDCKSPRGHLNRGNALLALDQADAALSAYDAAIALDSNSAPAHFNRGNALTSRKRHAEAGAAYRKALELRPDFLEANVALGLWYAEREEWPAAAEWYRRAIAIDPRYATGHLNLGRALCCVGDLASARASYDEALRLEPTLTSALHGIGEIRHREGDDSGAVELFEQVLEKDPQNILALASLGALCARLNKTERAMTLYQQCLQLQPANPNLYNQIGLLHAQQRRFDDAIGAFRRAVEIDPRFAEGLCHLGTMHREIGHWDEAVQFYKKSLREKAENPYACGLLADALVVKGQATEAIGWYKRALELGAPLDVLLGLAGAYLHLDMTEDAVECLQRLLKSDPANHIGRWLMLRASMPAVPHTEDTQDSRMAFERELRNLEALCANSPMPPASIRIDACFYLSYQERNNLELLSRRGRLCCRSMQQVLIRHMDRTKRAKLKGTSRISVGVVSSHFRYHSVWRAICKGWFRKLDPDRFALFGFYLANDEDEETRQARDMSVRFEMGPRNLTEWVETIDQAALDFLIYPEIGMDTLTGQLASMRLAPIQLCTWGHPETSGLETIDYYLSAEKLEPENAARCYSEQLILLPGLGCHFEPYGATTRAAVDFSTWNVRSTSPVLVCPGTPFKYRPEHDQIFFDIAKELRDCQFVFFDYQASPRLTEKLKLRLRQGFTSAGLDPDRFIRIVPWLTQSAFFELMRQADLLLDTVGFSGYNTVMQAVECSLPVVTYRGQYLRGRLGAGILAELGLHSLIADSSDEFAAIACRLIRNPFERKEVQERMCNGKSLLYENEEPIRALEDFLATVVRR